MIDKVKGPIRLVFEEGDFPKVDYLSALDVRIGVENQHPEATLIIESLGLRFESRRSMTDTEKGDPLTTVLYQGAAFSVAPLKLEYRTVQVQPTLLFQKHSNYFDVAISYRLHTVAIEQPRSFIGKGPRAFVIIRPAAQMFGKIYISYKEPEDRKLADRLFEFAQDAGFAPYMAPPDHRPGSRIWGRKIPAAIGASKLVFVIWTRNTGAGTGVKREIKIARETGIGLVPLLERRAADPKLFGSDVEYTRFDVNSVDVTFAKVVAATRQM